MLTMHPTMLVGPYDWDPERIPKEEFTDRIEAFWDRVSEARFSTAIVYGDSRNHAELAYLSHFTPKLGPALMLIPRNGEPTLLVSGAPNMLPAARRLTWIEKTQPLGDARQTISQWLNESAAAGATASHPGVVLIGGNSMRSALYRPLSETFGPENPLVDESSSLRKLMQYKRPRELAIIREACGMLSAATKALADAKSSGANTTVAMLEAERVAYQLGSQDVRTLFSLDGGRTLRPFEEPSDVAVDPLQAYIAVRHAGYWVEGFIALAPSQYPVLGKAADALKVVIGMAVPGARCRDLARVAADTIKPYREHALTMGSIGNSIGLFLEEEPRLLANSEEALESGCVYTLRVGASDGTKYHAIVSAMIAVHQQGNDLLWSAI